MTDLTDLLARLPDNDTGEIDADDVRAVVSALWDKSGTGSADYLPGRWYVPDSTVAAAVNAPPYYASGGGGAANNLHLARHGFRRPVNVDKFAITAGGGAADMHLDIGVFEVLPDGSPSDLIYKIHQELTTVTGTSYIYDVDWSLPQEFWLGFNLGPTAGGYWHGNAATTPPPLFGIPDAEFTTAAAAPALTSPRRLMVAGMTGVPDTLEGVTFAAMTTPGPLGFFRIAGGP
jgi:hypothetical protein